MELKPGLYSFIACTILFPAVRTNRDRASVVFVCFWFPHDTSVSVFGQFIRMMLPRSRYGT